LGFNIIDPLAVLDNHRYRVSFQDTLIKNTSQTTGYDTLTTKSFTMEDITDATNIDTLIKASEKLFEDDEQPIIDGFQLVLQNRKVIATNYSESFWNRDSIWRFVNVPFRYVSGLIFDIGTPMANDYRIIFLNANADSSYDYWSGMPGIPGLGYNFPGKEVNFKVEKRVDITGDPSIDWREIPFAFGDFSPRGNPDGMLNADSVESDWVIFLDDLDTEGNPAPTWRFSLDAPRPSEKYNIYPPQTGDTVNIVVDKPFLSQDIFEFVMKAPYVDEEMAKESLKDIKVVPNPYFAAASWESKNPFVSGRGPRAIHFNHLPQKCTIRIYTVSGELVKIIKHESTLTDGSESWDLLTKDNLVTSYGVYIYHVDAPGIGERVGKFSIIK
jgi:hypothetical protein